jgi:DNA-binding transcriptional MerR regulator
MSNQILYTLKKVTESTEIPSSKIKEYVEEFDLKTEWTKPDGTGQRRYTEQNISNLQFIDDYFSTGKTTNEIKLLLKEELKKIDEEIENDFEVFLKKKLDEQENKIIDLQKNVSFLIEGPKPNETSKIFIEEADFVFESIIGLGIFRDVKKISEKKEYYEMKDVVKYLNDKLLKVCIIDLNGCIIEATFSISPSIIK